MKNIQSRASIWTGAFALLFAAAFLLVLAGCQNPLASRANRQGTGSVSLSIGELATGRSTILPGLPGEAPQDFFDRFEVAITDGDPNDNDFGPWVPGDIIGDISAGTWTLTLRAILDDCYDAHGPVAVGATEITVVVGEVAPTHVVLVPEPGYGTFAWNITNIPATVDNITVRITNLAAGYTGQPYERDLYIRADRTVAGYRPMFAGRYAVQFVLRDADIDSDYETVVLPEILHVYRELTSTFTANLNDINIVFPSDLLAEIAAAWNAGTFTSLLPGHFYHLGINGVDTVGTASGVTARITYRLDGDPFPTDIAVLRDLVDVSLIDIAIAAPGFNNETFGDGGHATRADALAHVLDFTRNPTRQPGNVAISWQGAEEALWAIGTTTLALTIGGFTVEITFVGNVPGRYTRLPGDPETLAAARLANAANIVLDMQTSGFNAAHFAAGTLAGSTVSSYTLDGQLIVVGHGFTQHDGNAMVVLPPGLDDIAMGYRLMARGRFYPTSATGIGAINLRQTDGGRSVQVNPSNNHLVNPIVIDRRLSAADIANGLVIAINLWGWNGQDANPTMGSMNFVFSIDDMIIVSEAVCGTCGHYPCECGEYIHFDLSTDSDFLALPTAMITGHLAVIVDGYLTTYGGTAVTARIDAYQGRNFIYVGNRANNWEGLRVLGATAGQTIRVTGRTGAGWAQTHGRMEFVGVLAGTPGQHADPAAGEVFTIVATITDPASLRIQANAWGGSATPTTQSFFIYSIIVGRDLDLDDPDGVVARAEGFWPPATQGGITITFGQLTNPLGGAIEIDAANIGTVTAPSGFTVYGWYLGGVQIQTGPTLDLNTPDFARVGRHLVTLRARRNSDNRMFSRIVAITVAP